jgi:hypothetical protein
LRRWRQTLPACKSSEFESGARFPSGRQDPTLAQANDVTAITSYNQARNRLNVAVGEILEVNGVDMVEAIQGQVKRVSAIQ